MDRLEFGRLAISYRGRSVTVEGRELPLTLKLADEFLRPAEHVADATDGGQAVGVLPQLVAQALDVAVHRADIPGVVHLPHRRQQLAAGEDRITPILLRLFFVSFFTH